MIKILHSADWHLDSPLLRYSEQQTQQLRKGLQSIPMLLSEACRKEQCDLVLLSGDLFDGAYAADTLAIAREAGSEKAANVALIGLAGQVLGFDDEALRAAITACVPPKFTEVNLKAYSLGAEQASR